MGWEKDFEHMRDYGHTWGPGIDDYKEPTDAERLESDARFSAYQKELEVLRVPAHEKYVKAGEELKKTLPNSHDISFGNAPYNWREDYSTAKIELCKQAAEEMGVKFGLRKWPMEEKKGFMIEVERYGFLPGKGGNVHDYTATGVDDPMKCLQLVADFEAIGCSTTTYWLEKKQARLDIPVFVSIGDTGRLYKEMERWGVSFDKKAMLDKEIKQLAVELDQFVYDFDYHGYCDAVDDREQAVVELANNIRNGEVSHIKEWHKDITAEDYDWETALESSTLMLWLEVVEKKVKKELSKDKAGIDEKIIDVKKELSKRETEAKKRDCQKVEKNEKEDVGFPFK